MVPSSQGASYTLSSLTLPALLELPSAASAAKALGALRRSTTAHLNVLMGVAGTAFVAAFALSPQGYRHPYLLYTSLLAAGARLADYLAPALLGAPSSPASSPATQLKAAAARARRDRKRDDARHMEASYEDLGREDDHEADSSPTEEYLDEELVNGEDVRAALHAFTKAHVAQTAVAAFGFMMAVVGLWGDGVDKIVGSEAVLIQI